MKRIELFESFVNSEEYQTSAEKAPQRSCLRALLIQKSIKPVSCSHFPSYSLRALLIQKSIKQYVADECKKLGLRALLIQKSIKLKQA